MRLGHHGVTWLLPSPYLVPSLTLCSEPKVEKAEVLLAS